MYLKNIYTASEDALARTNSVMRVIDLSAKIVAPVLTGLILSGAGQIAGAITIAIWNLASLGAEIYVVKRIFRDNPRLKNKVVETILYATSISKRVFR